MVYWTSTKRHPINKPIFPDKHFLSSLSSEPGIYQFLDTEGKILYIGKARNLKKRVQSYFQKNHDSAKVASLVKRIKHIDVVITQNENEALLLENQLIKQHKPYYNILMRDDKSYPYIVISKHEFPRIHFQRGKKSEQDNYYGPYPSVTSVHVTLKLIQKIFKLRVCHDSFFRHRTRPCLLYHIKKCSGPCVDLIDQKQYAQDVQHAKLLLNGKNQQVINALIHQMEQAAAKQDYETAAKNRDQISSLRNIQAEQAVTTSKGDVDVFAVILDPKIIAVQLLIIRNGQLLGNKTFYPKVAGEVTSAEVLSAFIPQYYLSQPIPREIVIAQSLPDQDWLMNALTEIYKQHVKITVGNRGERAQWLKMAEQTGQQAIIMKLTAGTHYQQQLKILQKTLGLPQIPQRMECFDISHSSGEATVASCVVFDHTGPLRSAYRRFNITDITPGDDYAALHQALLRRYKKIKSGEEIIPDILFIDGGKGQLTQAEEVLKTLDMPPVKIIAVAKGVTRKPGFEQLFQAGENAPLQLEPDSEALHLIQHIRDEAHRFAITGQRKRIAKARNISPLENIPGIGAKRRAELLRQLGGLQEVKRASISELAKVPGISPELAQRIYAALHG